jgi:hypothetical protein
MQIVELMLFVTATTTIKREDAVADVVSFQIL